MAVSQPVFQGKTSTVGPHDLKPAADNQARGCPYTPQAGKQAGPTLVLQTPLREWQRPMETGGCVLSLPPPELCPTGAPPQVLPVTLGDQGQEAVSGSKPPLLAALLVQIR